MAKSLQQEEFDIKHANEVELAKRELARRALDTIRVYNPLDHTFAFMYDRYWHRIPAKSYKDLDRFLAIHFFKKICDFMIGQQIMTKGEELKALREKQLGKQYTDKYEENLQIWDRTPKLNDPELIEQIKAVVLVGVVEEYGADEPEPEQRIPDAPLDYRPMHERIFDSIDNKIVSTETPSVPLNRPIDQPRVEVPLQPEKTIVEPPTGQEPVANAKRIIKPLENVLDPKTQPKESLEKEVSLNG